MILNKVCVLINMKHCAVYFETWYSKWVNDPKQMDLAQISWPVTIVNLSFVLPGCSYWSGQNTFMNTGLNFSQDFWVVKGAIAILKAKGIKVMLAVGGGSYWSQPNTFYNAPSCVALMRDLGCDGIDLDWEVNKSYDWELTEAIKKTKALLRTGEKLSFCGWSTGAFGPTNGDSYKGMNIHAMVHQGSSCDWINIMAYDAGPSFDPIGALECYAIYYKGPLLLGFEVGTQAWGGALLSEDQAKKWLECTWQHSKNYGMFVWAYLKESNNTVSVKRLLEMSSWFS